MNCLNYQKVKVGVKNKQTTALTVNAVKGNVDAVKGNVEDGFLKNPLSLKESVPVF